MIKVFVPLNENVGYVWNSDDWLKIRQDFRIVGDLIGSLPKYPRQDAFKGLPLCLSPEEVTLLNEKSLVKLIHCPSLSLQPASKLKDEFKKQEIIFQNSQKEEYIQNKRKEVERNFDSIMKGKLQKNSDFNVESVDKKAFILDEVNKIQSVSMHDVSYTATEDPWIEESELIEVEWHFPSTDEEKLRYDVFKDLWQKNYYITSGTKFGGDFLCYPGDPIKFHATYIIVCKENDAKISMKDIVMYGRIGTTTKKTVAFASKIFTEDNEPYISYQSLNWEENKITSSIT